LYDSKWVSENEGGTMMESIGIGLLVNEVANDGGNILDLLVMIMM